MRGHEVIGVDLVDPEIREALIEALAPDARGLLRLLDADGVIRLGVDVGHGLRDHEDFVALRLEERSEISLGPAVVAAIADVVDVDAGVEGRVQQVILAAEHQARPAAHEEPARLEPRPAERAIRHRRPGARTGRVARRSQGRARIARAPEGAPADGEHREVLDEPSPADSRGIESLVAAHGHCLRRRFTSEPNRAGGAREHFESRREPLTPATGVQSA